jgi:hypothetical protein
MHPYTNHPTQAAKSVRPQPSYTDAIFKKQVTFEKKIELFLIAYIYADMTST